MNLFERFFFGMFSDFALDGIFKVQPKEFNFFFWYF